MSANAIAAIRSPASIASEASEAFAPRTSPAGDDAARPAWLTDFHRDGFAVIDGMIPPHEIEALRKATNASEISSELLRQGSDRNAVHLLGLTGRDPVFLALARDPRILDLVEAVLGADIQLQHAKLAIKPTLKGHGAYAWHQDFAFFPHTNTSLVAVMVMLDDATEENGCMRAVRGSHRSGLLEHRVRGSFSGGCQERSRFGDGADIVPMTPKAGGISIHHCLTLHGSADNRSGLPRRGLVFQYRADDAYQLGDSVFDDTGLLVRGTRRGVVRCEAGTWLLPSVPSRAPAFGSAWNQEGERARALNPPIIQPDTMPMTASAV